MMGSRKDAETQREEGEDASGSEVNTAVGNGAEGDGLSTWDVQDSAGNWHTVRSRWGSQDGSDFVFSGPHKGSVGTVAFFHEPISVCLRGFGEVRAKEAEAIAERVILEKVKGALRTYHVALLNREHGGIAAHNLAHYLEELFQTSLDIVRDEMKGGGR